MSAFRMILSHSLITAHNNFSTGYNTAYQRSCGSQQLSELSFRPVSFHDSLVSKGSLSITLSIPPYSSIYIIQHQTSHCVNCYNNEKQNTTNQKTIEIVNPAGLKIPILLCMFIWTFCRKQLTQQPETAILGKSLFPRLALGWHLKSRIQESCHHSLTDKSSLLCLNYLGKTIWLMLKTYFPSWNLEFWYVLGIELTMTNSQIKMLALSL